MKKLLTYDEFIINENKQINEGVLLFLGGLWLATMAGLGLSSYITNVKKQNNILDLIDKETDPKKRKSLEDNYKKLNLQNLRLRNDLTQKHNQFKNSKDEDKDQEAKLKSKIEKLRIDLIQVESYNYGIQMSHINRVLLFDKLLDKYKLKSRLKLNPFGTYEMEDIYDILGENEYSWFEKDLQDGESDIRSSKYQKIFINKTKNMSVDQYLNYDWFKELDDLKSKYKIYSYVIPSKVKIK